MFLLVLFSSRLNMGIIPSILVMAKVNCTDKMFFFNKENKQDSIIDHLSLWMPVIGLGWQTLSGQSWTGLAQSASIVSV